MNAKTTGIVAYLTWIGTLIAFLAGDKEGAKFHLNQALVLLIASLICSFAAGIVAIIPILGWIIALVLGLASFVIFIFQIMGLVYAIQGVDKAVPLFGKFQILK
ncbi:MAG: hypothetical protein IJZ47_03030 [Oscillospiraceae bacterium]|nr:hypothetical protein [Oscillospiraceae bacterium]